MVSFVWCNLALLPEKKLPFAFSILLKRAISVSLQKSYFKSFDFLPTSSKSIFTNRKVLAGKKISTTQMVELLRSFLTFTSCQVITKNELKELIAKKESKANDGTSEPEYYLVDVREPSEIKSTGNIPTAINIPLATLNTALHMNEEEFQKNFSCPKPKVDSKLIFSCRSGMRSERACNIAKDCGFQNILNYKGSANDWFSNN